MNEWVMLTHSLTDLALDWPPGQTCSASAVQKCERHEHGFNYYSNPS